MDEAEAGEAAGVAGARAGAQARMVELRRVALRAPRAEARCVMKSLLTGCSLNLHPLRAVRDDRPLSLIFSLLTVRVSCLVIINL